MVVAAYNPQFYNQGFVGVPAGSMVRPANLVSYNSFLFSLVSKYLQVYQTVDITYCKHFYNHKFVCEGLRILRTSLISKFTNSSEQF